MIIFFSHVPENTRHKDLVELIKPAMKSFLFGEKGTIKKLKIVQLKDPRNKISEYHALVSIEPETVAKRVIKRLNRKKLLGRVIEVRRYYRRNKLNDRRFNFEPDVQIREDISERPRRRGDRRRKNLKAVEVVPTKFYGDNKFSRKNV